MYYFLKNEANVTVTDCDGKMTSSYGHALLQKKIKNKKEDNMLSVPYCQNCHIVHWRIHTEIGVGKCLPLNLNFFYFDLVLIVQCVYL